MAGFEEPNAVFKERTIRYAVDERQDAESQIADSSGMKLTRRASNSSMASSRSGRFRRSVDPSIVLPIEYRTLSFHIEESKDKSSEERGKNFKDNKDNDDLNDLDWHKLRPSLVSARLNSSLDDGLAEFQVVVSRTQHGRNVPSKPKSQLLRKTFTAFFGGFGAILLTGSILVFIAWKPLGQPASQANMALAIVLLAVFFLQAAFNGWQDFSSSRTMASITGMLPESSYVIRSGATASLPAPEIVPGDIVLVKSGTKIPADLRLVEVSTDVKFDRSILTGESAPLPGTVDSTDNNYLETRCIAMQGTYCTAGSAKGIVVATGDSTVFGRISKLSSAPDTKMSVLQKEILRFVLIIISLMLFFIIVVIAVWAGYLRTHHPDWISVPNLIVSIVSVGIAFVPEGLPIALTASLTIVASKMKQNNVLCKSLKTVETLGAVSVICSDKTGTLTRNQMRATNFAINYTAMVAQDAVESEKTQSRKSAIQQLRAMAGLCNAAEFDVTTLSKPVDERIIQGDATDQAVLRFSETIGPVSHIRSMWTKMFEISFNSKNKFMIRLFKSQDLDAAKDVLGSNGKLGNGDLLLTIKGAPDVLIKRCSHVLNIDGSISDLTPNGVAAIEAIKDDWSSKGQRVILLARKILRADSIRSSPEDGKFEDETLEHATYGLTLVGLIGLVDPPRDEIPEVVSTLRLAGIRIFMVTGDFKLTALAIAQQCGIVTKLNPAMIDDVSALKDDPPSSDSKDGIGIIEGEHSTIVLSGPDLKNLSVTQWDQLCRYDEIVFARTTPEQKLRIVLELQRHENLVAMTGDGVNDAPSLKAADIGIALGTGSDIAIEAADMVLLDSFAGIVQAVLYGRIVFDNLKKTITYLLPAGSFSEFWPVLTNVIFGLPQILSSFLMIIICCLTDCAAATTLAYEKPEADVMLRPPRRLKKDRLVDWRLLLQSYIFIGTIESATSFAMAYWHAQRRGVPFSLLWFGYGKYGDLDPTFVQQVLNESSSIYFVNLVVMQWFNILATRTRRLSIFQHPPIFNRKSQNLLIFPAIAFAIAIIFIFCYIPSLASVIGSTPVSVEYWFLPIAYGTGLLLLDEARKWSVRSWPGGVLAKMAW